MPIPCLRVSNKPVETTARRGIFIKLVFDRDRYRSPLSAPLDTTTISRHTHPFSCAPSFGPISWAVAGSVWSRDRTRWSSTPSRRLRAYCSRMIGIENWLFNEMLTCTTWWGCSWGRGRERQAGNRFLLFFEFWRKVYPIYWIQLRTGTFVS